MIRKIALTLLALFYLVCQADNNEIPSAINRQLRAFPHSHLQDIYKSFYQSYFGAEHLITDTVSVRNYLHKEIVEAATDTVPNPYYEPVGANGEFVRVYLRCVTENLISEQQLMDAFLRSAHPKERLSAWSELWQDEIVSAARSAGLDFSQEELDALTEASRQQRAVRHSDCYRNTYHPHYRIVARTIFEDEIKPHLLRGLR